MIRLIAAIDRQRGIAKQGVMPWYIPEDEAYFTSQTKTYGGHVLTGGKTFRDTYKNGPLADRENYVLTHEITAIAGVTSVHDLDKFLADFIEKDLWVAGGAMVFAQVLAAGRADELYLTLIDADFGCDQFFPAYQDDFVLAERSEPHQQNGFNFSYAKYVKVSRQQSSL
jgi:dihydrofolate reductase